MVIKNFKNSNLYRKKIHNYIVAGSHTYSKGDDQFPLLSPAAISYGKGSSIWDIDGSLWKDKSLIFNFIKTFNYCVFSSGVYWYDNELEQDKKLLQNLPSYFKDKTFIKKLIKIKDTSNNLAYKKAYRLLYAKNPP